MQENNFEKQVQQKTNELKLRPSEEVWQKVSLAIAKRKTDRKIFALALLLLIFTGATVFFIGGPSSESKTEKNIAAKETAEIKNGERNIETGKGNQPDIEPVADAATSNKNAKGANTDLIEQFGKDNQPAASLPGKTVAKTVSAAFIKNNKKDQPGLKIHHQLNTSTKGKMKVTVTATASDELAEETVEAGKNLSGTPAPPPATIAIDNERISDTVSKDKNTVAKPPIDTPLIAASNKKPKEPGVRKSSPSAASKKWTIGLRLSGGIAATKSGYLGIGLGGGNEEKAYSDAMQSGNNGSTGGGQPAISHTPSVVKTGLGLMAGAYAQKNIGSRTSVLIGLNYKRYTSTLSIGERVDSSAYYNFNSNAGYFYRSGNKVQYKNHFHFIEIPVLLRYRLTKETKLPVYVDAGLTLSRLISSSALQFDASFGSYYNDTKPFNKTVVDVSASLLFSLSGNSPHPFLIGPDINFSLNKMATSGLYQNRRYSYFGLQLQRVFGKK